MVDAKVSFACFSPDGRHVLWFPNEFSVDAGKLHLTKVTDDNKFGEDDANFAPSSKIKLLEWAAFSHSGEKIAAVSLGKIHIFDRRGSRASRSGYPSGSLLHEIQYVSPRDAHLVTVSFSQDDEYILTFGWDGIINVWHVDSGILFDTLDTYPKENTFSLSDGPLGTWAHISPCRKRYVTGYSDGTLQVWDATTKNCIFEKKFPKKKIGGGDGDHRRISCVHFSHKDSNLIAVGVWDYRVYVIDIENRSIIHTLVKHTGCISTVFFSSDDTKIISAASDGTANLWSVADGSLLYTVSKTGHRVKTAMLSNQESENIILANLNGPMVIVPWKDDEKKTRSISHWMGN